MISKPLSEIVWSDIVALRERGRQEDDTIEYKGSFSGGSDFLAFTDQQKKAAVDGIAKEVVAFLNARGGDVIIGAKEAGNENPVIEAITPLANVQETADRLDSALAALIEPKQAIIGVRAIRPTNDATNGVIVIRAPSSLRAPHRTSRDKDCHIRRGSKSVPMPMDEIQDVTLGRAMRRSERNAVMDQAFEGLDRCMIGARVLSTPCFILRLAFVPFAQTQIVLTRELLSAIADSSGRVYGRGAAESQDFLSLIQARWKPVLRGYEIEQFQPFNSGTGEFFLVRTRIKSDGSLVSDFGCRNLDSAQRNRVFTGWLLQVIATSLRSIDRITTAYPNLLAGLIRVGIYVAEDAVVSVDDRGRETVPFSPGLTLVPDFEISTERDLEAIFCQVQHDIRAMVGKESQLVFSLDPPT